MEWKQSFTPTLSSLPKTSKQFFNLAFDSTVKVRITRTSSMYMQFLLFTFLHNNQARKLRKRNVPVRQFQRFYEKEKSLLPRNFDHHFESSHHTFIFLPLFQIVLLQLCPFSTHNCLKGLELTFILIY